MACECYVIGGPWIAEDPECEEHGWRAEERARIEREDRQREEELDETQIEHTDAGIRITTERGVFFLSNELIGR